MPPVRQPSIDKSEESIILSREWARYTNEAMGVSFCYPRVTELRTCLYDGHWGGQKLNGSFTLSSTEQVRFGAVSRKSRIYYRGERGDITEAWGYREGAGIYVVAFAWGEFDVEPYRLLPVNGGQDKALFMQHVDRYKKYRLAAVVNIPNALFPAATFLTTSRAATVDDDIAELCEVVSSLKFLYS